MSKAEKTREFIIEKSSSIFNKKGYSGTTLSDIMEATSLTKGAIYGNFENKDEIAIAVYKYNINGLRKRQSEKIIHQEKAIDKLIAFTDYYRENWEHIFKRGGCPIQNASIEADDNLSLLKKHVQDSIRNWVKDICRIIEQGQKSREFKSTVEPSEYAYEIITILEGGIMLSKIMNDQALLFSALDRINKMIITELKK